MNDQPVSRRKFLKSGCLYAAAIGVTVCGGGALAATYQPKIDQPSASLGSQAGGRVLVAYATKAGSTAQVAARMGELLSRRGLGVDVRPLAGVTDLAAYQTVILGSAIRTGAVLPEAQAFVEKNQAALQQKPFHLFILCMTLQKDTPENRQQVSAYLDPLRAVVRPASEGLFAGMMDPGKLKLYERLIVMAMQVPNGDYRNWDQIGAWAEGVPLS